MLKVTLTSLYALRSVVVLQVYLHLRFSKPGVHRREERGPKAELSGRSTAKACAKSKRGGERDTKAGGSDVIRFSFAWSGGEGGHEQ